MRIAIAGATGFIGRNLLHNLRGDLSFELVALSRRLDPMMHNSLKDNILWRKCDGFNFQEVIESTINCDILIYLIHSMHPTATLVQGRFEDFDAIVADNFARAVSINKIKHIIYLGGLIPQIAPSQLSTHLHSRLEVESILKQYQNSLTTIRAGLVIGNSGSSYIILERLINRLPILICPKWTENKMQPIALSDLLIVFKYCLNHFEEVKNKTYDVGSEKKTSYLDLLTTTAKIFNKKRYFLRLPFLSPNLSKHWVTFVTRASKELVFPLVESLVHEMLVSKEQAFTIKDYSFLSADEAIKLCEQNKNLKNNLLLPNQTKLSSAMNNVTSLQRLPYSNEVSATFIAKKYTSWLNRKFRFFIKIHENETHISFVLLHQFTMLQIEKPIISDETDSNYIYTIREGLLVSKYAPQGTFEFRKIKTSKCFIIGIYNYSPALPWFIYRFTQARIHLWVMKRFISWYQKQQI